MTDAKSKGLNTETAGQETCAALLACPGPVLVLGKQDDVHALNAPGELLATALKKPFGAAIASVLKALAIDAHAKNEAVSEKISLPAEHSRGGQWLDATLVPQENGETLILCRDITIDVNVRSALVESRQRYKDLVEIACDFAWETDSTGCFTFISKDQVIGYTSKELIGVNPEKLLAQSAVSTTLPFHPEDTINNQELWLSHADGHPLCVMVAALPLFDGLGRRTGTRGICTDISVQRLRDDILSRSRMRDREVTYIVDSFRSKERPQEMLKSAASSIGRALEAQGCDIFIRTSDGELSHAASFGIAASEQEWSQRVLDQIEDDSHFEGRQSNFSVLAATTEVNQRGNGAIMLLRASHGTAWTEEDRVLLTALREPLGMALAHIAEQQKLEELSRIDELTGLLNRRAFNDDLRARLSRSVRRARAGALIYVDLDNFKPVNDTHGHDKGDEVLRVLAKILHDSIREYDLAGRIGGDEFAIWLDDANDVIAMKRGESIVQDCKQLAKYSANEKIPLSVSAGIAVYDPDTQESLEDLVVRADQAMYEAKRNGKGRAAMASHAVLA